MRHRTRLTRNMRTPRAGGDVNPTTRQAHTPVMGRMSRAFVLALALLAMTPSIHGSVMAASQPYYVWQVTIQGGACCQTGSGNFTRPGYVLLTPTIKSSGTKNAVTTFDVLLVSGTPESPASMGAIQFVTNTDLGALLSNPPSGRL